MPRFENVDKRAVRQFLLQRQFLETKGPRTKVRPDDVLATLKSLEAVQLDPVAAVERNQHLVFGARIPKYEPKRLEQLLEQGRAFEYWANAMCVMPMEDYPIFEPIRKRRRQSLQSELDNLGSVVDDVLKRLETEGPLPSKAFTATTRVSGYWDNSPKTKATSHALNILNDIGTIQVTRREGTTRYFNLPERIVPQDLLEEAARISDAEAKERLLQKYLRAYRVFDPTDYRFGWQRMSAADRKEVVQRYTEEGRIVPLNMEGVRRNYFILAEDAEALAECVEAVGPAPSPARRSPTGDVWFLPPLDNLLWRRERIEDLFQFSYTWEVYIPEAKRQFGYYTMPILVGDQFVGRMDPRLDREQGLLHVKLLHIESGVKWTKSLQHRVFRELERFAGFHKAKLGRIEQVSPEGLRIVGYGVE